MITVNATKIDGATKRTGPNDKNLDKQTNVSCVSVQSICDNIVSQAICASHLKKKSPQNFSRIGNFGSPAESRADNGGRDLFLLGKCSVLFTCCEGDASRSGAAAIAGATFADDEEPSSMAATWLW